MIPDTRHKSRLGINGKRNTFLALAIHTVQDGHPFEELKVQEKSYTILAELIDGDTQRVPLLVAISYRGGQEVFLSSSVGRLLVAKML